MKRYSKKYLWAVITLIFNTYYDDFFFYQALEENNNYKDIKEKLPIYLGKSWKNKEKNIIYDLNCFGLNFLDISRIMNMNPARIKTVIKKKKLRGKIEKDFSEAWEKISEITDINKEERNKFIVFLFDLKDIFNYSYRQIDIANEFGISTTRIAQIRAKAYVRYNKYDKYEN